MSRTSNALSEALARRYRQLDGSRRRIEELFAKKEISRRAVEHMYEGLFLNVHRAFEAFMEDLFIGLLVDGAGLTSARRDIYARVTVKSNSVARELIVGRRGRYVDWLPYEKTLELAKLFFRGGRPFSDLPDNHIQQIAHSVVLRNAIAHTGRYSQDRFHKIIVNSVNLPLGHRSPAGYLRDVYAKNPLQTRYELITAQLLAAARILSR